MTKENPNDVIVESGNLSNAPDRIGLIANILTGLGYDAVGVGETDLRTCGDEFFKQTAENKLRVLDASPEPRKSVAPYLIKNVDGVKVGIISFGSMLPDSKINEYTRRKVLYTAFKAARSESDILIVLDQANLVTAEWLERNGKRLGAPDIVIGGVQQSAWTQEQVIGKTHLAPTSIQGKHIGVIDVTLTPGQEPKYQVQKRPLETDVAEDETVSKRVKDFMAKIQQVPTYTPPTPGATPQVVATGTPGSKPYYPPMVCRTCHVKQFHDWLATKHSKAVATLTTQERAIPECLKCHSEMYRTVQRVDVVVQGYGGVECASCHSDSLPHGSERKGVATRKKVDLKVCLECHNQQWSPNYEEKSYLAKVSHLGMSEPTAAQPGASPAAARTSGPAAPSTPAPPLPKPPAMK